MLSPKRKMHHLKWSGKIYIIRQIWPLKTGSFQPCSTVLCVFLQSCAGFVCCRGLIRSVFAEPCPDPVVKGLIVETPRLPPNMSLFSFTSCICSPALSREWCGGKVAANVKLGEINQSKLLWNMWSSEGWSAAPALWKSLLNFWFIAFFES